MAAKVEEAGTQACPLEPWEEQPAVGAMEAEVQVAVEMATAAPTVVVMVEGLAEVVGAARAQLPCTPPKLWP